MRMSDLEPGWAVVTNDGHHLGTIKEVGQNYLLASRSGRGRDLHVPAAAIANVDRSTVYLNVDARAAAELGWEQPLRTDDEPTGSESDLHRHV